jgi:hypothetical protein
MSGSVISKSVISGEASSLGYLTAVETRRLGELCLELGRMLGEMMIKADQFCQSGETNLQETSTEYHITEDASALIDDGPLID